MANSDAIKPAIFVFTTTYFPNIGGVEVAIREIAGRLPQYDWALFCARLDRALPKRETIDNMNMIRLGWGIPLLDKTLLPFTSFFAAWKLVRRKSRELGIRDKTESFGAVRRSVSDGGKNKELGGLESSRIPFTRSLRSGFTRQNVKSFVANSKLLLPNSRTLLWSVMASYASFGALFLKLLYPQLPFVLTLQEGDSERHVHRALSKAGPFHWLLFRKINFLTAISEYLGWFARRLGYYGRIRLVPNGVDLERFDVENLSLKSKAIKTILGIPADAPIVISVSRLVEKNGIEDLILGFAQLKREDATARRGGADDRREDATARRGGADDRREDAGIRSETKDISRGRSAATDDAHLFILGEGVLQERLESIAQATDAHERIHFLGTIPHTEVPNYIGAADVFVRPSLSEGQGVSFLEAMAMGVPIVGTPVGGIPDFLHDGETGLFCEVQNPASIAVAIERLLNDKELRNRVIENAYRLVKERYSWEKIAPMMEEVFRKFLISNYPNSPNQIPNPNS